MTLFLSYSFVIITKVQCVVWVVVLYTGEEVESEGIGLGITERNAARLNVQSYLDWVLMSAWDFLIIPWAFLLLFYHFILFLSRCRRSWIISSLIRDFTSVTSIF